MKVYCMTIYFSNSDSALSGTKVTGGKNGEVLAAKLSSGGAEVYQIQDSIPEPATAPQVKNGTCYPQQSAGHGLSLSKVSFELKADFDIQRKHYQRSPHTFIISIFQAPLHLY